MVMPYPDGGMNNKNQIKQNQLTIERENALLFFCFVLVLVLVLMVLI